METGIFGLILYLWILAIMIKDSIYIIRNAKNKFYREIAIIFQSIIWGLLVWSITTRPSEYVGVNWYLFLLVSIIQYYKMNLSENNRIYHIKQ